MKNKKGQILNQLGGLAIGVAVLAILLTITFTVISEGRDQTINLLNRSTFINQSETITVDQFTLLSSGCIHEEAMSVVEVYNGTPNSTGQNSLLDSGNYTVLDRRINVSDDALGARISLGTTINISYSCKAKDAAYNSTVTLANATQQIPGWIPLIIIAVIGSILLGLVALFRRSQ